MTSRLTIKLPDELEEDLSALSKRLRLNRSDIVRMALENFIGEFKASGKSKPYDKVANIIGSVSSGIPDLGEAHRKYLSKR
jgi:metal-responsive CopG/Arc/MetJ family transcriptional regulator